MKDVQNSVISPIDILRTYGKVAAKTQEKTNAITELMLPEAETWALQDVNLKGPLAGIPVSLKDSIAVGGFDVSVGYSRYANQPYAEDGIQVKLLKKAGAIPYVKTALPITLLSFESSNSLWGIARNPHSLGYSPGGSTGGEGALLAAGGSRIGIGSDVAGSVRAPAAWSGIYSLKCSTGRWPKMGMNTSMPGQEGIPSVFSPMARTLDDLTYFTKAFIGMKPWEVDYSVHPISWRTEMYEKASSAGSAEKSPPLKIGVLTSDGVVPPTPAIARALSLSTSALVKAGHSIIPLPLSSLPQDALPAYGLSLAALLLNSDGTRTFRSFFRTGEATDPGAAQLTFYMSLPRWATYAYYLWVKYVRRDHLWASVIKDFHPLSAYENWSCVARREKFRATWFDWWNSFQDSESEGNGLDFILCPANATPALPHGAMHDAVSSCGYTFLWNLLDYSAGVVPVTKVDRVADKLHESFRADNAIARGAYKHYDSEKMVGLPCAVQVVGRRLREEQVLGYMKVLEDALREDGVMYEHLEIE